MKLVRSRKFPTPFRSIAFLVLSGLLASCDSSISATTADDSNAGILGLRTVIYYVSDIGEATEWYSEAFGVVPYFDEPFYVGFNIGGFELGLSPDEGGVEVRSSGNAYWGVANIHAVWTHLIEIGASPHNEIEDVGGDIYSASVRDPWGNIVGLIQNPHFDASQVR